MASSFAGLDLFGSGPHRFSQLPLGEYILVNARVDPNAPGSTPIGPLELVITIRGRLVAANDEHLWTLRDDITTQLTHPPTTGTLKEIIDRSWDNMSFVNFAPGDRTDRGRGISLAYTATFIRFLTP